MRVALFIALLAAVAACSDETGQSAPVRFVSLAAGSASACGLTVEGEAFCWGGNNYGQLGTGDTQLRLVPSPVAGDPRFSMMDQGATVCAVDLLGRPYCWGASGSGVTGNGSVSGLDQCIEPFFSVSCHLRPQGVRTGEQFREVVNNGGITCGLTEGGQAHCWGVYQGGYLGAGVVPDGAAPLVQCSPRFQGDFYFEDGRCATAPVAVEGKQLFRSIAAGAGQVCGTTEGGELLCWARPTDGDSVERYRPTTVPGAPALTQLSGAGDLLCGVTATGAAYCWGAVFGAEFFLQTEPTAVGTGIVFTSVTVGGQHACAATPGGTAYCWGVNHHGQLGDGTTMDGMSEGTLEPVFVAGGHRFRSLAAGSDFTCGITFEGETYCWGANGSGQLGDGTLTARLAPTLIDLP
jgi:alpha-tubulin suppressor-like RCC1 family protein